MTNFKGSFPFNPLQSGSSAQNDRRSTFKFYDLSLAALSASPMIAASMIPAVAASSTSMKSVAVELSVAVPKFTASVESFTSAKVAAGPPLSSTEPVLTEGRAMEVAIPSESTIVSTEFMVAEVFESFMTEVFEAFVTKAEVGAMKLRMQEVKVVPRTGADEDSVYKIGWPPVPIRSATKGIIRIVSVKTYRLRMVIAVIRSNVDTD